VVLPALLPATPAVLELCRQLLEHWRSQVGRPRGEIEEGSMALVAGSRMALTARGLQKLICDACRFTDNGSAASLRADAFRQAAARLARPAGTLDEHLAAVASAQGMAATELMERLYGDLPQAARLEAACPDTPDILRDRYNLALCQSLLLGARALEVVLPAAATGDRRRLLQDLRFRRLVAEVTCDQREALHLTLSGPASVLDQASRYGLQLGLFLPSLCSLSVWQARARVRVVAPGRGQQDGDLLLSHELGLRGHGHALGHVPDELQRWQAELARLQPDWRIEDAPIITLPGGEWIVPDACLVTPHGPVAIELFHRWHARPLARRVAQVQQGRLPHVLLGVDRALLPAAAALIAPAEVARQVVLFRDLPTARALAAAVQRLHAP
jgi:predicted nuclease of restriction endonuclease-like RecB superfamily